MAQANLTLIFVDVDGVLNVGIKDSGEAPLLLDSSNIIFAELAAKSGGQCSDIEQRAIEKLLTVIAAKDTTGMMIKELACTADSHISAPLVRRLADIIVASKCAGPTTVILASNRRSPRHASRVHNLEEELSLAMGKKFTFDGRTRPGVERDGAERLKCIGDYLESTSRTGFSSAKGLARVLVLDDLFVTPLDGWICGSAAFGMKRISREADVETNLCSRIVQSGVSVKMIHPYFEWTSASGEAVPVGCGLSEQNVQDCVEFFSPDGSQYDTLGKVVRRQSTGSTATSHSKESKMSFTKSLMSLTAKVAQNETLAKIRKAVTRRKSSWAPPPQGPSGPASAGSARAFTI